VNVNGPRFTFRENPGRVRVRVPGGRAQRVARKRLAAQRRPGGHAFVFFDGDGDSDSDSDCDPDPDTDPDPDADADAELDTDTDTDGGTPGPYKAL
jgi:hypothetical protein